MNARHFLATYRNLPEIPECSPVPHVDADALARLAQFAQGAEGFVCDQHGPFLDADPPMDCQKCHGTGVHAVSATTNQAQRDAEDCTVVVCKCGKAVFLAVTSRLERKDKNELGRLAAAGCEIKHMPVIDARGIGFGRCACGGVK